MNRLVVGGGEVEYADRPARAGLRSRTDVGAAP